MSDWKQPFRFVKPGQLTPLELSIDDTTQLVNQVKPPQTVPEFLDSKGFYIELFNNDYQIRLWNKEPSKPVGQSDGEWINICEYTIQNSLNPDSSYGVEPTYIDLEYYMKFWKPSSESSLPPYIDSIPFDEDTLEVCEDIKMPDGDETIDIRVCYKYIRMDWMDEAVELSTKDYDDVDALFDSVDSIVPTSIHPSGKWVVVSKYVDNNTYDIIKPHIYKFMWKPDYYPTLPPYVVDGDTVVKSSNTYYDYNTETKQWVLR